MSSSNDQPDKHGHSSLSREARKLADAHKNPEPRQHVMDAYMAALKRFDALLRQLAE